MELKPETRLSLILACKHLYDEPGCPTVEPTRGLTDLQNDTIVHELNALTEHWLKRNPVPEYDSKYHLGRIAGELRKETYRLQGWKMDVTWAGLSDAQRAAWLDIAADTIDAE